MQRHRYNKMYREANRELLNLYHKEWFALYYLQNRELILEKNRKYNHDNRIRLRPFYQVRHHNRMARMIENGGSFTVEQWNKLVNFYAADGCCPSCGRLKPLEIDHVVPLIKGGPTNIDNLQPLCKVCNCSKGTTHIDYRFDGGEYARRLSRDTESNIIEQAYRLLPWDAPTRLPVLQESDYEGAEI